MTQERTALNLADRSTTHKVVECKFCGAEVAWLKSKRTGRSYLADVVHTPTESMYRMSNLRVAPWQPHTREKCEARQAERGERLAERILRDELMPAWLAEFDRLYDADRIDEAKALRDVMPTIEEARKIAEERS